MASITFANGTIIPASWLNDVDASTYQGQLDDGTLNSAIDKFKQSGTGAVTRTVQDKVRESVSVLDFGADPTGVVDSTLGIQAACNTSKRVYFPTGTYLISAAITPLSNQVLYGDGKASVITSSTININNFFLSGLDQVRFYDLSIVQTGTSTAAYLGLINLFNSTNCIVERCHFAGAPWTNVYLNSSQYCQVSENVFTAICATVAQDTSDVCLYNNASHNNVIRNKCVSGAYHGVLCQDPTTATTGTYLPFYNKIAYNEIVASTCTGIIVYIGGGTAADSHNKIIGNTISGVTGANGTSNGQGIYVVGTRTGGTIITDNTIINCCISTSNMTNQPGGITLSPAGTLSSAGVVCSNNTITGMTRGNGIIVVTSTNCPVALSNNTVIMPSTNNVATFGAAACTIYNSSNVSVSGGFHSHAGDRDAFLIYNSSGSLVSNISVSGITTLSTGTGQGFITYSVTSNISASISGVSSTTTNAATNAMQLAGLAGASISGCVLSSVTAVVMSLTRCTQTRVSNCYMTTTGTVFLALAGTCTGTLVGDSNYVGTNPSSITNSSTGGNVQWRALLAPISGTWAVGDRVSQLTPVVGNPKGWSCTVAGNPGTWVSEGNL